LRLPAGKHAGILTDFQAKVNKKNGPKVGQNFGRPAQRRSEGIN
jgi:hypothetical protein